MDEGTLTWYVNGKEQPYKATGLQGKEIYPAVQFYNAQNQVVELMEAYVETELPVPSPLPVFALRLLAEVSKPDSRGLISAANSQKFIMVCD